MHMREIVLIRVYFTPRWCLANVNVMTLIVVAGLSVCRL